MKDPQKIRQKRRQGLAVGVVLFVTGLVAVLFGSFVLDSWNKGLVADKEAADDAAQKAYFALRTTLDSQL